MLNTTLGIYEAILTVGEKNLPYLISPALCLAVTVIKFLQRHFGVNKADVGLKLVFDSFDVLVMEKQNTNAHTWSTLNLLSVGNKDYHRYQPFLNVDWQKQNIKLYVCESKRREQKSYLESRPRDI